MSFSGAHFAGDEFAPNIVRASVIREGIPPQSHLYHPQISSSSSSTASNVTNNSHTTTIPTYLSNPSISQPHNSTTSRPMMDSYAGYHSQNFQQQQQQQQQNFYSQSSITQREQEELTILEGELQQLQYHERNLKKMNVNTRHGWWYNVGKERQRFIQNELLQLDYNRPQSVGFDNEFIKRKKIMLGKILYKLQKLHSEVERSGSFISNDKTGIFGNYRNSEQNFIYSIALVPKGNFWEKVLQFQQSSLGSHQFPFSTLITFNFYLPGIETYNTHASTSVGSISSSNVMQRQKILHCYREVIDECIQKWLNKAPLVVVTSYDIIKVQSEDLYVYYYIKLHSDALDSLVHQLYNAMNEELTQNTVGTLQQNDNKISASPAILLFCSPVPLEHQEEIQKLKQLLDYLEDEKNKSFLMRTTKWELSLCEIVLDPMDHRFWEIPSVIYSWDITVGTQSSGNSGMIGTKNATSLLFNKPSASSSSSASGPISGSTSNDELPTGNLRTSTRNRNRLMSAFHSVDNELENEIYSTDNEGNRMQFYNEESSQQGEIPLDQIMNITTRENEHASDFNGEKDPTAPSINELQGNVYELNQLDSNGYGNGFQSHTEVIPTAFPRNEQNLRTSNYPVNNYLPEIQEEEDHDDNENGGDGDGLFYFPDRRLTTQSFDRPEFSINDNVPDEEYLYESYGGDILRNEEREEQGYVRQEEDDGNLMLAPRRGHGNNKSIFHNKSLLIFILVSVICFILQRLV